MKWMLTVVMSLTLCATASATYTTTWVSPTVEPVAIVHAVPGDVLTLPIWYEPPTGEWIDSLAVWHGMLGGAASIVSVHPLVGHSRRAEAVDGESWLELAELNIHGATQVAELTVRANECGESCIGTMPLAGAVMVTGEPCIQVTMLGDMDADLAVTGLDVMLFIEHVVSGEWQFEADMNRDGTVTGMDVGPFTEAVVGVESAPEPSVLVLAGIAGLCFIRKGRS